MRKALLILVFALVAAACGGTESSETQQAAPSGTEAPAVSAAPTEGSSDSSEPPASSGEAEPSGSATAPSSEPSFDGPPAPDFELALANGTAFNLAAEQKPVYMVFWAEW